MDTAPSMTNTKKEILEAYNKLLKKRESENQMHPKDIKVEKQKEEAKKISSELSPETIVKGFADLKLNISESMDKLEDALLKEFQKFEKLQEAIRNESSYLDELYEIKANADSLAVLLTINKEKKETFETEMEQKKSIFDEIM
jgi:Rad3-related DNA helicase